MENDRRIRGPLGGNTEYVNTFAPVFHVHLVLRRARSHNNRSGTNYTRGSLIFIPQFFSRQHSWTDNKVRKIQSI